jgi:1-acyl-sn-glycerol-3-phosphate acyltransferase
MPSPPPEDSGNTRKTRKRIVLLPAALLLLAITVIAYNLGQCVLWVLLRPFSPRLFIAYNHVGSGIWWGLTVKLATSINNARIEVTGDELPRKENAILVCNHQQMTDIAFLLFLAVQKGRAGDMIWFVKDSLKYVPGIGWGMWFYDNLFVKRRWARDQSPIKATFLRIIEYDIPLWIVLFAEGTRITSDKLLRAQSIATRRGKSPLKHLLNPHTRGFEATVCALRRHLDAVYDITIGYERGVPSLWQYICGSAPVAHFHVQRHAIKDLPEEAGDLAKWLRLRFEEKDSLLDRFHQEGGFPSSVFTRT